MSFRWTSVAILGCGGSSETDYYGQRGYSRRRLGESSLHCSRRESRERGTLLGEPDNYGTPEECSEQGLLPAEGGATQDQGRGVSLAENSSMASHGHRRKLRPLPWAPRLFFLTLQHQLPPCSLCLPPAPWASFLFTLCLKLFPNSQPLQHLSP